MIDFYLPIRKLAIEVDELGRKDRKQPKKKNKTKIIRGVPSVYVC